MEGGSRVSGGGMVCQYVNGRIGGIVGRLASDNVK